jgi:hypothetical protein
LQLTAVTLILSAGFLPGATLSHSFREGNTVFLEISDGTAQIEWLSESSFRFSRRWEGAWVEGPAIRPQTIDLKIGSTADALSITSKYLKVTITKHGVLVHVDESDGKPLMADASEVVMKDGSVSWERMAPAHVRYFGLGARESGGIELRGTRVTTMRPFLISTAGYGEWHPAPGRYDFDLAHTRADRYHIEAHGAAKVDYYFFFGPTPKEILEQYLLVDGPMDPISPGTFHLLRPPEAPKRTTPLPEGSLAQTIHRLINSSLSGILLPAISLDSFQNAPDPIRRRAAQLGSVSPIVLGSRPDSMRTTWRADLTAYFTTYGEEARERGLPMIHALPIQYPKDVLAAKINDEFMLGDELLIAPLYQDQGSRSVYFPMGTWTRLSDNQVYQGRRTYTIDAGPDDLPVFARNGSIVPLGSAPMKLHYFPKLGGEFFLYESDLSEYSQVHAGPAGDFMRLETESKKDRGYEWIVHHLDRPKRIAAAGVEFTQVEELEKLIPGAWFYDTSRKNLHVRIAGRAGGDEIVTISF